MNKKDKSKIVVILLIAMSFASFCVSIFAGSSNISIGEVISALFGNSQDTTNAIIVNNIRLPRAIFAFFAGGALSAAGVCLQGIFRNPMADSYILGVSSGAGFGATIAIALTLPLAFISIFAFICALITCFAVYSLSKFSGKISTFSLILSGIAISALLTALMNFIMIINKDKMETVILWMMGSLSAITWEKVIISAPVIIICFIAVLFFSRDLNIMLQGDEEARHLGVDVDKVRKILLLLTALLTCSVVSFGGVIGFVGLIIPHIMRLILGPDHKKLIWQSFICGGIFLLLCDTVSRVALPMQEIPIGIITAMFGAPYLLYLLRANRKRGVL